MRHHQNRRNSTAGRALRGQPRACLV